MASNSKFARAARACRHKMPKASSKAVFRCIKAAGGLEGGGGRRKKGGRRRGAATPSQYAAQRRLASASRSCKGRHGKAFRACVGKLARTLSRAAR